MSFRIVLFCLASLMLIEGCGKTDNRIEYHPMPSRIPYWDSDASIIEIEREYKSQKEVAIIPGSEFFESVSFLDDFEVGQFTVIEELILNTGLAAGSIDSNRVLFLDSSNNILTELDVLGKDTRQVAGEGKGPGELMFARDLVIQKDTAYVVSENGTLSLFDCSVAPCSYSRTVRTDKISTLSAAKRDDELFLLGYARSLTEGDVTNSEMEGIFKTDLNGNIKQRFGKLYDIDGRWIMLLYFAEGGIFTGNNGQIIQYYRPFPNIYIFNEKGSLDSMYRIDDFILSKMKYDAHDGSIRLSKEDWSSIEDVVRLRDQKFILSVVHRKNRRIIENVAKWSVSRDYYYLDTESGSHYLLGSLTGESKYLYFTDKHIIVQQGNKMSVANFELK